MLRFYFVLFPAIFLNFYYVPWMWYLAKHPDKYSEETRYNVGRRLIRMIKRRGRITTISTGKEFLPKEGGYIMYSNHQGKYDMLGIVSTHDKPCSIVIDKKTTKEIMPRLYTRLVRGQKLDKKDPRQQVKAIHQVIKEIIEGRRYLLFPEGGYTDNKNNLLEFHTGSFKIPLKAKCPIIPIAIYDSYKPFTINSIKRVTTQVHYLEPIYYEQYAGMSTREICDLVYNRINDKLNEIKSGKAYQKVQKAV
ncbi:MAG: 1-acyl-sn-glycerol-3-phosphate acyltransferase [Clostridiales bacterium]|jgi:1-acyl-sn-glycerol-3-phosphate acyltransferase|nr:1-acyl-sn-glycerol-3-phosphate acyltransferase [Clostridiales bacterium]